MNTSRNYIYYYNICFLSAFSIYMIGLQIQMAFTSMRDSHNANKTAVASFFDSKAVLINAGSDGTRTCSDCRVIIDEKLQVKGFKPSIPQQVTNTKL